MIRPDSNLFQLLTFDPERRADIEAQMLQERCDKIATHAVTMGAKEEARHVPPDMLADLIACHVRMTRAYWAAEGRCASAMITGPANFPTDRNRKRLDTADRRRQEVQAHLTAALRRLERFAFPHGMGDVIRSADPDALAKLRARLAEAEALLVAYKAANASLRKGDWVGVAAAVGQERADRERAFVERWGYGGFNLANRRAEIRRIADRITGLERMQARGTQEREAGEVRVVENVEAARIQLIFPGKPDDATRAKLKSHGFRWAPSEGAWQRHLNNAGRYAAKVVLDELIPPAPKTAAERYGIAITARFTDDDAANAYMTEHPGEGVLEVVGGEIQIARCDDLGSAAR